MNETWAVAPGELLLLLQLTDSALPVGGYSHSWGLETWVQQEVLTSGKAVREAIELLLEWSIAPADGIACALAHRYSLAQDAAAWQQLNRTLDALRWSEEPHQASLALGQRLVRLATDLGLATDWPPGSAHHAAVFGWLAASRGMGAAPAVAGYLQATAASLISACVRLVPLGHTEGQRIVLALQPRIAALTPICLSAGPDALGGFAPLHEWACQEHRQLYSRLFQS